MSYDKHSAFIGNRDPKFPSFDNRRYLIAFPGLDIRQVSETRNKEIKKWHAIEKENLANKTNKANKYPTDGQIRLVSQAVAKAGIKTRLKAFMDRLKIEFDAVFAELFPGFNRNKRAIKVDEKILKEE